MRGVASETGGGNCFISGQSWLETELKEGNLEGREVKTSLGGTSGTWHSRGSLPGEFGVAFPWILGKSRHGVAGEGSVKINGSLKPERGPGRARQGQAGPGRYEAALAARDQLSGDFIRDGMY